MFGWFFRRQPDEVGRSGQWARVRAEHLKVHPNCIACGRSSDLEVHHVESYAQHPEKELDPTNLVTLCADPCHIVHGHLMAWTRINPSVREDAARYRRAVEAAK